MEFVQYGGNMNLNPFGRIRKNHALEHATIAIAHSRLQESGILSGNSTHNGFFVYGNLPTEILSQSVSEALNRLQSGEKDLAISPYCGTNLVVTATLTGLACAWVLGNGGAWSKIPRLVTAALGALLAARPIGTQVQRTVTTSTSVDRLGITEISRMNVGKLTVHRVRTSCDN